jgi:nitrogen regulatory protein P-II 1
MKLVVAVIRPEKFKAVQAALAQCGIEQMTVTDAVGKGHQLGHSLIHRGLTIQETLLSRIKLESAVDDHCVNSTVEAIQSHGQTGEVGDGMILVCPLEQFVRIRTGEGAWRLSNGGTSPRKRG